MSFYSLVICSVSGILWLCHFGDPNSSVDLIVNGEVKQRRYFDNDGNIIVNIDFSHGGKHPLPHKHVWINNEKSKHNYE